MYLSYSGHKTYKECPRQYWHRYIGKTKLPTPDNRVNALYGSAVGTIFEAFYNEKVWAKPNVRLNLESRVDPVLGEIVQRESRDGTFDWKDPKANYKSLLSVKNDVLESIPRGIAIIKYHKLLGPKADAEVKLDTPIEGHQFGGRADFIIQRTKPHNDLVILDGKGSRHRDKYVDPQQLWWYAMLYRRHHTNLPDRLGFIFWRQDPEKSLDWVNFSAKDLDALQAGVLDSIRDIESGKVRLTGLQNAQEVLAALKELFPTFVGSKCGLCAFLVVCVEGQAYKAMKPPTALQSGAGVDDVSF